MVWGLSALEKSFKRQGVLKLQPHDHACLVYESESEWRNNVIPFIIVGLQQGEKCVYGLNHRSQQYIENCLREEGINVGAYKESGQLLILDKSILPGECAIDRLDQIQAFYIQFLEQALSEGYPAVRCTNESLYTLLGMGSAHNMVEVNSRMNTVIFPHYPCVALCQYDRFKTDPKILKYAILSHPIVIRNSELYVNLSSIRDERFLEITSNRWEAEHWLAVIERENREMEKLQMINHTLNKSSQPLLCFHADGSVIACNEAFYQLMGRSGERIQHLGEIEPYWHDYLTVVIQELKQRGAHRYERERPQPDGSRVVLDMSVLAGFDDSGNVAYYYASIVDVTRQKEAQGIYKHPHGRRTGSPVVQDEGNGIDQDLLDKLGTPFFTTKDNGTGLGLAICFSIVARHEASIHPYTSPNGSTFVISFKIPSLSTEQMTLPLI